MMLCINSEVIDYERESDRSATIAEYGRGTRDLRISMFVQVLEQALLAESTSLREAIMGLVDRAIERVVAEELFQVIKSNDFCWDEISRDANVFRMWKIRPK